MIEAIMGKLGTFIADFLWNKLEAHLIKFFETRNQIKAIATEAEALKSELRGSTTEAEYDAILQKISNFSSRIKL